MQAYHTASKHTTSRVYIHTNIYIHTPAVLASNANKICIWYMYAPGPAKIHLLPVILQWLYAQFTLHHYTWPTWYKGWQPRHTTCLLNRPLQNDAQELHLGREFGYQQSSSSVSIPSQPEFRQLQVTSRRSHGETCSGIWALARSLHLQSQQLHYGGCTGHSCRWPGNYPCDRVPMAHFGNLIRHAYYFFLLPNSIKTC